MLVDDPEEGWDRVIDMHRNGVWLGKGKQTRVQQCQSQSEGYGATYAGYPATSSQP
jgi:hypothetical protein